MLHELLSKAERALVSAKLLLQAGDPDGAGNRAYYAMFDAARAGLMHISPEFLSIEADSANWAVMQARIFVAAVRQFVAENPSGKPLP